MADSKLFDQAGLVGKSVLTKSSAVVLGGAGDVRISVLASEALSNAVMTIVGPDGLVVDKVQLGGLGTEIRDFVWDGANAQGNRLPSGAYRVTVEGKSAIGAMTAANVLGESRVEAVRRIGTDIRFVLSNGSVVSQSDVVEIGSSAI